MRRRSHPWARAACALQSTPCPAQTGCRNCTVTRLAALSGRGATDTRSASGGGFSCVICARAASGACWAPSCAARPVSTCMHTCCSLCWMSLQTGPRGRASRPWSCLTTVSWRGPSLRATRTSRRTLWGGAVATTTPCGWATPRTSPRWGATASRTSRRGRLAWGGSGARARPTCSDCLVRERQTDSVRCHVHRFVER